MSAKARKNLLIVLFFAIQLALPVRGLLYSKYETRGDFSWNMYAMRFPCEARYFLEPSSGAPKLIDHEKYFARSQGFVFVQNTERLPKFHQFLCEEHKKSGLLGRIRGVVSCKLNDDPPRDLVQRNVDICTSENFGVRELGSDE